MKILITEQQLKSLEELSDKVASEIEIIYRDKNVICLIPKSQYTSRIYGHNAKWCQRTKSGFNSWSKSGLLIRFLLRGGRKIRFTYYFIKERVLDKYYWANEDGLHRLFGSTDNPFDAINQTPKDKMETDIIEQMHRIPEQCKIAVLEFIKKHQTSYDYCYSAKEYISPRESTNGHRINKLKSGLKPYLDKAYQKGVLIGPYLDFEKNEFFVQYNNLEHPNFWNTETFPDYNKFKNRVVELIKQTGVDVPPQPNSSN